jgi:hypothetical protein
LGGADGADLSAEGNVGCRTLCFFKGAVFDFSACGELAGLSSRNSTPHPPGADPPERLMGLHRFLYGPYIE